MLDKKVLNKSSRRNGKIYICNPCGTEEAMIDIGRPPTQNEVLFVAKLIKNKNLTGRVVWLDQ
jgi:hypothetical protein